jgi:hypothetical protein
MADNLDPVTPDNQDPAPEPESTPTPVTPPAPMPTTFTWKDKLNADIKNSPTLQKFDDSKEGLAKAIESHLSLEKLLGHEKVPIPKSADDVEGWNRFSKAMGIPDKAEGYGLADVELPGNMKELSFDKNKFAETVHAFKLTPGQAQGLWKAYTQQSMEAYSKFLQEHEKNLQTTVTQLRSEWGDSYEANVDLGQTVINKFAGDKETEDYLTSIMTKDPRAIKFLAKIGNQFAENKVGEFQIKRFSLAPDEASAEIDKILADPNHPYKNEKASPAEHTAAVDYVNSLYQIINKAKQG